MQATESSELSSDEPCVLYKAHEKVPIISDQHHVFCDVDIQRDELTRCMDGVSRKMLRTLRHLEITQHIINYEGLSCQKEKTISDGMNTLWG